MGEEEGKFLAGWLNSRKGKKSSARLLRLLIGLRELSGLSPVAQYANRDALERLLARPGKPFPGGRGRVIRVSLQDLSPSREYVRKIRRVDAQLARYKVRPRLTVSKAPLFAKYGRARHLWDWHGKNPETDAVLKLLELEQQGLLDRVRECRRCGQWLFARFVHQRFCTQACQLKAYQSSEYWREHRRQWWRAARREGRAAR